MNAQKKSPQRHPHSATAISHETKKSVHLSIIIALLSVIIKLALVALIILGPIALVSLSISLFPNVPLPALAAALVAVFVAAFITDFFYTKNQ